MKQRTKQKLAVAVAASLSLSGCLPSVRFRPRPPASVIQCDSPEACSATDIQRATGPVNTISPFIRIVGESAPPASFPELELLAAELHSELAFRGGVKLENSALVAQLPVESCGSSTSCGTNIGQNGSTNGDLADGDSNESGNIKTMSAQFIDNAGNSSSGASLGMGTRAPGTFATAGSHFEVGVIVNDFTPYRPMQLAATFIIRDLSTGYEIHRIQRVWRGITHEPEFEATRKQLNGDLRHPATRQRLEHTALPDISPRHLIKRAATEVADSLYQSVLKPQQPVSGQYSSALQESHRLQ